MRRAWAAALALVTATVVADARHALSAAQAPKDAWSGPRGDADASGATSKLPSSLAVKAKVRLPTAAVGSPAVTPEGDVVVAVSDGLVVIPADGGKAKPLVELPSPPSSGPLVAAPGEVRVPLVSGELARVDVRTGRLLAQPRIGSLLRAPAPWIDEDGTLSAMTADAWVTFDARGELLRRQPLGPAPAAAVARGPSGAVVALESGKLLVLAAGKTPRALGTVLLPRAVHLARHGDTLWIGDSGTLERRSISSGATTAFTLPSPAVAAPAVTPEGDVVVVLRGGLLVRLREDGSEGFRVSLPGQDVDVAPVVAADGRILFARKTGEVGFVAGGAVGEVVAACPEPSALAVGGGRAVVLCDDGQVFVLGG